MPKDGAQQKYVKFFSNFGKILSANGKIPLPIKATGFSAPQNKRFFRA